MMSKIIALIACLAITQTVVNANLLNRFKRSPFGGLLGGDDSSGGLTGGLGGIPGGDALGGITSGAGGLTKGAGGLTGGLPTDKLTNTGLPTDTLTQNLPGGKKKKKKVEEE